MRGSRGPGPPFGPPARISFSIGRLHLGGLPFTSATAAPGKAEHKKG